MLRADDFIRPAVYPPQRNIIMIYFFIVFYTFPGKSHNVIIASLEAFDILSESALYGVAAGLVVGLVSGKIFQKFSV